MFHYSQDIHGQAADNNGVSPGYQNPEQKTMEATNNKRKRLEFGDDLGFGLASTDQSTLVTDPMSSLLEGVAARSLRSVDIESDAIEQSSHFDMKKQLDSGGNNFFAEACDGPQQADEEAQDLSKLFQVVNFSAKDDPSKLKRRTAMEYTQTVMIVDTGCVVQWPVNLTDESLIRGRLESGDSAEHNYQFGGLTMQGEEEKEQSRAAGQQKFFEETLTCLVCFNLVTDPQDCLQCDQTLCGTCRRKVKDVCPQCRGKGFKKGHKMVRQLLNSVILSCPNKKFHDDASGICEVVLTYADMKVHLEMKCPFRIVKCHAKDCTYSDFARNIGLHEGTCSLLLSSGRQGQAAQQMQPSIFTFPGDKQRPPAPSQYQNSFPQRLATNPNSHGLFAQNHSSLFGQPNQNPSSGRSLFH